MFRQIPRIRNEKYGSRSFPRQKVNEEKKRNLKITLFELFLSPALYVAFPGTPVTREMTMTTGTTVYDDDDHHHHHHHHRHFESVFPKAHHYNFNCGGSRVRGGREEGKGSQG